MNRWITTRNNHFIEWGVSFREYTNEHHFNQIKSVVETLLESGERNNIYSLIEQTYTISYRYDRDGSYLSFMDEEYKIGRKNKVVLFDMHRDLSICKWKTPSKIAYFTPNGNEIIEEEVNDLSSIPYNNSDEIEVSKIDSMPPVHIYGGIFRPNQRIVPHFRIGLFTDIWFPVVQLWSPKSEPYDNSMLASRHTPKLNRFIRDVRQAAKDVGATWYMMNDRYEIAHPAYLDYVAEDGIILD